MNGPAMPGAFGSKAPSHSEGGFAAADLGGTIGPGALRQLCASYTFVLLGATTLALAVGLASPSAWAAGKRPGAGKKPVAASSGPRLAPIRGLAFSTHSPYGAGDCSLCHERNDPKAPGAVAQPVNSVCYSCHEDLQEFMAKASSRHRAAEQACTGCHNPHNSTTRSLLLAEPVQLCLDCHPAIRTATEATVKHGAVNSGRACLNCHSPHASNVEHVLIRLPFELCISCHDKDGMLDKDGKLLTNYKKLLDNNPVHHAPVAGKDCSSCHEPHGSGNFRLLVAQYPETFYAAFKVETYALCFSCHDDKMVSAAATTTATRFRDGDRNLHFLHVNNADRGRTCRACHEVHASKQAYQIRDGVPFGPKGYVLKVNFQANPNGGTCQKTCHSQRTYVNSAPRPTGEQR